MRLMRDLVGETLSGRYRLVARIAGGGMGEVYRGHDLLLDRAVAVKVLQPALASEPELVDRFRLEARAAARLLHPSVVTVYDWGEQDARTYYMVMEYVSGTDLRDVLVARPTLEPAHAIEIVAQICDALAAAHDVGLVHRDVKPENVLIASTGEVKVADFGIAVIAGGDLTAPGGNLPGTLRYLSPEQARGSEATSASDIWATGAVLAECLTGRPPMQGSGADLLRRRAEEDAVPPSALDPSVPSELDDIVLKACALHPVNRYETARDMGAELRRVALVVPTAPPLAALLEDHEGDAYLRETQEPTSLLHRAPSKRRRERLRAIARTFVALVVVALAVLAGARAVPALFGPAIVEVPRVATLSKVEAVEKLKEVGLKADVVGRRDKFEERGEVLDQSPLTGTLEEGSTVTLTVSTGPPRVKLPSLIGMTPEEAAAVLTDDKRGMTLGDVEREFSLEKAGTIVSYSPSKARLPWGSSVDVAVSKGPEPLEIPEVVGMTAEKATTRLEEAGFSVVPVDSYSDEVAAGNVIGTEPAAKDIAPEGSEVQLLVSIGPEYEKLKLPDVRGMTVQQARSELEALGLRVDIELACDGGTIVQETEPTSGSTVLENDLIALFVC